MVGNTGGAAVIGKPVVTVQCDQGSARGQVRCLHSAVVQLPGWVSNAAASALIRGELVGWAVLLDGQVFCPTCAKARGMATLRERERTFADDAEIGGAR